FGQHNAHWIAKGLPGAGNVLIFNNGMKRPGSPHSTVDEIVLPVDGKGRYEQTRGRAFGPKKGAWTYAAPKKNEFYAPFISGAHRLPNGNPLICSGTNGTIFEVTADKEVVWKYLNPVKGTFGFGGPGMPPPGGGGAPPRPPGGFGPPPGFGSPPRLGQVLSPFMRDVLKMTDDQKKKLDVFEKEVSGKLEQILNGEQNKQLKEARPGFGPGSLGPPPPPGQLLSPFVQA